MRFEILSKIISGEMVIDSDNYSVTISVYIKDTLDLIPMFVKNIEVISHNSQTGYEVDQQRQSVIDNLMIDINI